MTTPPSKPAKSKAQDARTAILQQAKLLFRQKGFSAVSMNDLVAAVGLTKPTIYYHFSDKETLFAEVVVEMMRHGNELFTAGIKRCKTTEERLIRLAEGYFKFSPTSLSTMVRDCAEQLSEIHLKKVMEAQRFYLITPIQDILAQGVENGTIGASEKPETLALYFISWIDAMTLLKTSLEGRHFDAKGSAENMVRIFLNGVAPPLDSNGSAPTGTTAHDL